MSSPAKTLSSALVLLLTALVVAGCGTDRQESVTVSLETFTTPDGNIGCTADDSTIRCDIAEKNWQLKPEPSCPTDYGNGISLADGKASLVCAGDSALSDGPELEVEKINLFGPFECAAGETGESMRCENINTGNGFELSPENYEIF